MKTSWMLLAALLLSIMTHAQKMSEQNNLYIAEAKRKAATYAHKMNELLGLSKKQMAEVYKLRLELSLAIQVICAHHSNDEKKLVETLKIARRNFHTGMLKVLDEQQATRWNDYKREYIASQSYQDMINSTAILSDF